MKLIVLFLVLTQILGNNLARSELSDKLTSAEVDILPDDYEYDYNPDESFHNTKNKRRFRQLHPESNLKHLTQMIAECILISNSCTQQKRNNLIMAVLYEKNKSFMNQKNSSANAKLKIMNDFMPTRY
jgi:hypothetical protein